MTEARISKAAVLEALHAAKGQMRPSDLDDTFTHGEVWHRAFDVAIFLVEQMEGDARRAAPVARRDGPDLATRAAARQEPRQNTDKAAVLAWMRDQPGWLTNKQIAGCGVGGDDPCRRMRQLRDDGWIVTREHPERPGIAQHRVLTLNLAEQLDLWAGAAPPLPPTNNPV